MNKQKWESLAYQQIKSVKVDKGYFYIEFLDGSVSSLTKEQLLPFNTSNIFIEDIHFNPYEVIIPTDSGENEVPWTTIRLLTDPDFASYWANLAETEASQVGKRIKELRKRRNLSSKEVAERAGISPQSLSRIENGRHDVVFTTLKKILAAMGYSLKDLSSTFYESPSVGDIYKRLEKAGINKDLFYERLVPNSITYIEDQNLNDDALNKLSQTITKIFKWPTEDVFSTKPLVLEPQTLGEIKFKTSKRHIEKQTLAYTFYAHYMSLLALNAYTTSPKRTLPSKVEKIRAFLNDDYGSMTFENLLNFIWDSGIPVLPFSDPGAFHGACWNVSGRFVIALKQVTSSQGRWLFDLAHELGHIILHLSRNQVNFVEGEEITPLAGSKEEIEANNFAADLLLFGKQEELAEKCADVSLGKVENLKSAVIQVASNERVPVDLLANYLAFRLQLSNGISWWGTANNLQITEPSPLKIAKQVMLKRLDLNTLSLEDRELFLRAFDN